MRFVIFCLAVISFSAVAHAQSLPAFTSFGEGFEIQKKSVTVIENMPRVMSQDTLGICYAYATASMMQINNCRITKQDCKNLPDNETFSPLDVARFGNDPGDSDSSYESSFRGINEGGPGAFTLEVGALHVGSSASEECMSLNKILSKMDGAQGLGTEAQLKAFQDLQALYKKSKSVDKNCEACMTEFYTSAKRQIDENFCVNTDQTKLLKAFAEETYETFFDRLVSPRECKLAKNRVFFAGQNKMEIETFPKAKKDFTKKAVLNKLKSVLKQGLPVMMGDICIHGKPKKGKCEDKHVLVVSGYARMCDPAGNCYDAMKLQNSWGQSWQKGISKNISPGIRKTLGKGEDDPIGDGWVAADELLQNTDITKDTLAWLQDKTATN